MASRRQPGKGKERRDPPTNRGDNIDDDDDSEEQPIPRPKDDRILSFIPNDGIDYKVIRTEVQSFLGPEASVTHGKHPRVSFKGFSLLLTEFVQTERPGYFIRAYNSISISMISDFKMDTIRWYDEMRQSNIRDYKSSNTHKSRQKYGPTEPLVSPSTITPPSQYPNEEPRSVPSDTKSRTSEISYRDTYPERANRGQQPQTQRGYEEPTRSSDSFPRSDPQRHAPQSQESHPSAYSQASTAIYIQNIQPQSATATIPSSSAQPTFTRQDVEKKVMQKLRDQGHKEITQAQLNKAVDHAMQTLAREERATSVPPPYSEHAGGQGQPRPSQPNTTGTRGFPTTYATAGPDDSRPSDPGYSKPPGPDYSKPPGPDYSKPSGPDYSRPSGPDHSRPSGPDYSRHRK
jgi:hypothetical protein